MRVSTAGKIGVALLLAAFWAAGGCSRKPAPSPPGAPRRAAPQTPAQVVTAYLNALEDEDYAAAYQLLTDDSRSGLSASAFRRAAEQGGPVYDLEQMNTEAVTTDSNGVERVRVTVQHFEDPAQHGFLLERQDSQWRIVFHSGLPAAPSAD